MLKKFAILLCSGLLSVYGTEVIKLTANEKQFLTLRGKEVFSLGKAGWKIFEGESKEDAQCINTQQQNGQ